MKTVTKIILCSCLFCYFAGLWMIASRFGLIKLVTRYGLASSFDQIPKNFPQIRYLYIGLLVYTILYIILSYIIYKHSEKAVSEQQQLQQEAFEVISYAEKMSVLLSQYERSCINDPKVSQKLQVLSRQIKSLPPSVIRNITLKSEVTNIVSNLQNYLSDNCSAETFSAAIDVAHDAVNSIKRRSVNIK